jgi:hypothetical protein
VLLGAPRGDPFKLDSYLLGVTATSSRTWEQMKANPGAKTLFTFQWTEPGPLAHLMANGGAIPNPITLEMSLLDLGGALFGGSSANYGAFDSLQDIQMDSNIHMVDRRGRVDIAYDVGGKRDSVRSVVDHEVIGLHVDSLVSTDGTFTLSGSSRNLAYASFGLSGALEYSLSSGIVVTSDFGSGSSYPSPTWSCK